MARHFNLTIYYLFILFMLAVYAVVPKIHKPWLVKSAAKVVTLECSPPLESSKWSSVDDIKLLAYLPQRDPTRNETLASMTPMMDKPSRSGVIPDIARVTFSGQWENICSLRLSITMPLTSRNYGTYYCSVKYKRKNSNDGFRTHQASIQVNGSSSDTSRNKFKMTMTNAHNVTMTWQPPEYGESEFTRAEVSLTYSDKVGGRAITAPRLLFMTDGNKDPFLRDVLFAKFQNRPGRNYSILVYLNSSLCYPFCYYSCKVAYPSCIDSNAHLCICGHVLQNGARHDSTATAPNTSTTDIFQILFFILAVITGIPLSIFIFRCWLERTTNSCCNCMKQYMCFPKNSSNAESQTYTALSSETSNDTNRRSQPQGNSDRQSETSNGTNRQSQPQGNSDRQSETPNDTNRRSQPQGNSDRQSETSNDTNRQSQPQGNSDRQSEIPNDTNRRSQPQGNSDRQSEEPNEATQLLSAQPDRHASPTRTNIRKTTTSAGRRNAPSFSTSENGTSNTAAHASRCVAATASGCDEPDNQSDVSDDPEQLVNVQTDDDNSIH